MTEGETLAILKQACEAINLDADGARLLRLGSNAVYMLTSPAVVRIARPEVDTTPARRLVNVARWLESVDYPAVRALALDQPLIIDGHAVTFWVALSDDGNEYATIGEVADVIARLHQLTTPAGLHLPTLEPFADADCRIAESQWLTEDDRSWMFAELARLRGEYSGLEFPLPGGVIHGDANIGNVLRDYDGKPIVIDLDDFCVGPREWDLIQTAIYYDHFGWHTFEEYKTFVQVYGYDIMKWDGYQVLAEIREFIMVTWMILKAEENERTAAEAAKRLSALQTGASRKDWSPF